MPRRVINLNAIGGHALAVIGLIGLVLPALLYALSRVLEAARLPTVVVRGLMMGSLVLGGVLFAAFILLLIVEQKQDAFLYRVYRKGRGKRIRLADGRYECQFCGCRSLRAFETTCPVCGKSLE